jgi:hypothetical protein
MAAIARIANRIFLIIVSFLIITVIFIHDDSESAKVFAAKKTHIGVKID